MLTVWYVENKIDLENNEAEQNALIAVHGAAQLSQFIVSHNPCVKRLFTTIYSVVVDKYYNLWFAGKIKSSLVPETKSPSDSEIEALVSYFEVVYLPSSPISTPLFEPNKACAWKEARKKIQRHFSPDRENVSFYFVVDGTASAVFAQWDGPTDAFLSAPSILNVAMELECVYPPPVQLVFVIVDERGEVGLIGSLPADGIKHLDLSQLQILYQK